MNKNNFIFILLFIVFSIPPIINGMAGGRHTIVPDISIAMLIVNLFLYLKNSRLYFTFFLMITLLINQGNAWAQVIACRINNSIYEHIKELDYKKLNDYEYIIFDQGSFSKNIKHSLLSNDKILERYFGAQALEEQTVITMIALEKKFTRDEISNRFFSVINYEILSDNNYSLNTILQTDYREFNFEKKIINSNNILVINYNKVYKDSFTNGNRK